LPAAPELVSRRQQFDWCPCVDPAREWILRLRRGSAGVTVVMLAAFGVIPGSGSAMAALPVCPEVYGHGGYPASGDTVALDRVRQPNHPRGLAAQRGWGADGVEADVQLTRDGTKAVMWHNTTTGKLTDRG
jgi:hypothetical protein